MNQRSSKGFTIAELITVVAIIGILCAVALPVARLGMRRQKEIELKERLRKITDAIDRYHDTMLMRGTPIVPAQQMALDSEGYPKDLEELLKGIKMSDGRTLHFIRERDLIDPMTGRNDWDTLSSSDDPERRSGNGVNVFEVHSKSTALALDGKTHYNEW